MNVEKQQKTSVKKQAPAQAQNNTLVLGQAGSAIHRIARRHYDAKTSAKNNSDRGVTSPVHRTEPTTGGAKGGTGKLVSNLSAGGRSASGNNSGPNHSRVIGAVMMKKTSRHGPGLHLVTSQEYARRRGAMFSKGSLKERQTKYAISMGFPSAPAGGVGLAHTASISQSEKYELCHSVSTTYICSIDTEAARTTPAGERLYAIPLCLDSLSNSALQAMRGMYAQAYLKEAILSYVPNCPATTSGSLVFAISNERDKVWRERGSGANTIQEAYDSEQWVETQVWEPAELRVKFTDNKDNAVYANGYQGSFQDLSCGDLEILASADLQADTAAGHVLMTMEWVFFDRVWNFPDALISSHGALTWEWSYAAIEQGMPYVSPASEWSNNIVLPAAGPNTKIYSVVVYGFSGDALGYYINGMQEGENWTIQNGDRFFITQIEKDDVVYYQLFADGQGAYSSLSGDGAIGTPQPRGAILATTTDANPVNGSISFFGEGWIL